MKSIISVNNLIKKFGDITAVDGVSFNVYAGEMFGIVGPDGAGKTTTMRSLCGLIIPDYGEISLMDLNYLKNQKEIHNKIGYLSQKFSLYSDLTIDENIEFFGEIHQVKNFHKRRDELLEFTRLTPFRKRIADKLSGGMKQKLALACSLIHKPQILFLDEPTTGVDPVSRRDFWKILSQLLKEEITIFMSTPYMDEAERCNRIALMHNGKIISLDTPKNIKDSINKVVIEIICTSVKKAGSLIKDKFNYDVQLFGDRINIIVDSGKDEYLRIQKLLEENEIEIKSFRLLIPSLENVFIHLINKS